MQQGQGLNSLETKHWSNALLDVKICRTKEHTVSKHDIITEIIAQNIQPRISFFVLALVFSLPAVIFLALGINFSWGFLIFAVMFGIFGGLLTWMAIDSEIQRRQKLKKAINKDINISFFERICTDKQWGEYGSEDVSVVYQLFFGGVNYHVSKEAYNRTNINDRMMFVCADGEFLHIAYPLKCWDIEEE